MRYVIQIVIKKRNNIYIFFNSILHYNNHQKVKIICIKKTIPGEIDFLYLNVFFVMKKNYF